MNAKALIYVWLETQLPGHTSEHSLEQAASQAFGKPKWDSQMGYGEGAIHCYFPKLDVRGDSSGLCTSLEALENAVYSCLEKTGELARIKEILANVTGSKAGT